jgi:hypothetical protein
MSGKAIGYITLLIGYIITGVGIYYLSYAKGEYACNPVGKYLNECRNIGTDADLKFSRSRYGPDPSGDEDPDGSVKYVLQEDPSACPKRDCKVGPWMEDGGCYKESDKSMQKWYRTILTEYDDDKNPIVQTAEYGGKPCPVMTAITTCKQSPEPFRFLRRRKLGIEKNANYGGGIAGIVFGCMFMIVGHALVFTTKN